MKGDVNRKLEEEEEKAYEEEKETMEEMVALARK